MALLADLTPEELCKDGTVTEARKARARLLAEQPLGHDVLGALLAGALAVDIPRNLLSPFAAAARVVVGGQPRGGDRAEAIERAFEVLFPIGENNMPFMAPYLLLFYGDLGPQSEPPAGRYRAGMPLWIANGTDTGSGGRLLTVPFDPKVELAVRRRGRRALDAGRRRADLDRDRQHHALCLPRAVRRTAA